LNAAQAHDDQQCCKMKQPPASFRGVIPAIASPCDADDNFDEEAFCRLAAALWDEKIQGLYVCGLTGDGYQMTFEERKRAVELAVKSSENKGSIMAHVGTQDTRATCKLAAHAAEAGANGVAAIPPINRPFPEIERYYRELARAAGGLPVFIYHIPVYTKWEATFEQLERLSAIAGVSGIKFTDYNLMLMRRLAGMRPDFSVLYGRDEQFAAALALGSHGGVGSTFNVFPRAYTAMQEAVGESRLDEAFRIQCIVTDALILMDRFGIVACIEAILARAGLIQAMRRQPCRRLSELEADEMRSLLKPLLDSLPPHAQTGFLKKLS
jgi:N-acetylneuraminate lyase